MEPGTLCGIIHGVVAGDRDPYRAQWPRGGLGGIVCDREVVAPDDARYTLVVRRRGLPDQFAGGLAPIIVPLELAAFAVNRLLHRGYGVQVRPRVQPGWWKWVRLLPAEKIVVFGPFRRVEPAIAEAEVIASRLLDGDYAVIAPTAEIPTSPESAHADSRATPGALAITKCTGDLRTVARGVSLG